MTTTMTTTMTTPTRRRSAATILLMIPLAGCSSTGGGVATTTPSVPTTPVVTGGVTRSTGFATDRRATIIGATGASSAPGANGTAIVAGATEATFTAQVGSRTVGATLPLVARIVAPAGSPNNPLGQDLAARTYERTSGSFAAGNQRDEDVTVIDATYARVASYDLIENASETTEVYAVGPVAATTPRAVPITGTATYRGIASGTYYERGFPSNGLNGTVTLNADFGAGTIDGMIVDPADNATVTLESGTISGVEYRGTARVDVGGTALIDTSGPNGRGAFVGGFYGPNAEETAGVFEVRGADNQPAAPGLPVTTGDAGLVGSFIADR